MKNPGSSPVSDRAVRSIAVAFLFSTLAILPAQNALADNFVLDGNFSELSNGSGQLGYHTVATAWTNGMNSPTVYGYNFVYQPGIADTTGGAGAAGAVKLWGPGDGSANGLDGVIPGGGNYVAADGVYQAAAITQTITGLTVGRQYDLTFYYAGAQQSGFTGLNTEWWTVSLGSQSDTTPILDNANHGFTGWYEENFLYTATSSSEVLSFMAGGTPGGEPPFTLLTDVALVATPEPGTIGLVGLGLSAGLGLMLFSRRKALGKV